MSHPPAERARTTLREDLREAMRRRDRVAASALRAGISAIDQAEAVPMGSHAPTVGTSSDVPRQELTGQDVHAALRAEVEERQHAMAELRAVGQDEAADRIAHELAALLPHLPSSDSDDAAPVP